MKADKGNSEYDEKMKSLLSDRDTCESVKKPPISIVERELNAQLLRLKNEKKLDYHAHIHETTIY